MAAMVVSREGREAAVALLLIPLRRSGGKKDSGSAEQCVLSNADDGDNGGRRDPLTEPHQPPDCAAVLYTPNPTSPEEETSREKQTASISPWLFSPNYP